MSASFDFATLRSGRTGRGMDQQAEALKVVIDAQDERGQGPVPSFRQTPHPRRAGAAHRP